MRGRLLEKRIWNFLGGCNERDRVSFTGMVAEIREGGRGKGLKLPFSLT